MKKSLVALAALAATGAMAQVTITGIMDAGYQTGKIYGQSVNLVDQSGARTTTFKFAGVEDMGAGMKAKFQLEVQPLIMANDGNQIRNTTGPGSAIAANASSQAAANNFFQSGLTGKGYTYVGVEGAFGEVQFGTINSASLATHGNGSGAWGTGIGSGYGLTVGSTSTNTFTRFENSLVYITPSFNGFTARYLTNFKNDSQYGSTTGGTTARRPAISEIGAQYLNGPLQLNLAQIQIKGTPNEAVASTANDFTPSGSNVTTKTTTFSASYDLKVARLGFTNSKIQNDAGNTGACSVATVSTACGTNAAGATNAAAHAGKTQTVANMFYAQVPMGQLRLLGSVGNVKVDNSPAVPLIGQKTNVVGLGVEYDLSKRTYVYFRNQSGKANAANCATTYVNGALCSVTGAAAGAVAGQLADPKFSLTAIGLSHAF